MSKRLNSKCQNRTRFNNLINKKFEDREKNKTINQTNNVNYKKFFLT